jgi:hypothetical protein
MIVFAVRIPPDLEGDGTKAPAAPADGAKLARVVAFLANQIRLIKNFLRLLEADAVFMFDSPALRCIKLKARSRV